MWTAILATEIWPSAPSKPLQWNSCNVMFTSTYFYDRLLEGRPGSKAWELDEEVIMDWGHNVRWTGLEVVAVLICQHLHWTLVIADIVGATLHGYDSLGLVGAEEFDCVGKWINWRLKKEQIKLVHWTHTHQAVRLQLPGSNDCAMTLLAAMFNIRHGELDSSLLPLPEARWEMWKLVAWVLLRGGIE